ncbi:TLDc domain-containing protein [Entamoeba marina]
MTSTNCNNNIDPTKILNDIEKIKNVIKEEEHQQMFEILELEILSKWSGLNGCKIIFDSDLDGNGYCTLDRSIVNKRNLYLITFDGESNVYGGYITEEINKIESKICDENAFVFSLIRNGKVKNSRYYIKDTKNNYAFYVYPKRDDGALYVFGLDIGVTQVGCPSCCFQNWFDYKNETGALVNNLDYFPVQRIVVVQMH